MSALFVFLGGGTGSVLRSLVGLWIGSGAFPWATFAVGAVGGFVAGIVLFGESASALRIASAALIVAGIVGLKLATK